MKIDVNMISVLLVALLPFLMYLFYKESLKYEKPNSYDMFLAVLLVVYVFNGAYLFNTLRTLHH